MKKLMILLAASIMCIGLYSCGSQTNEPAAEIAEDTVLVVEDTTLNETVVKEDSVTQCVAITKNGTRCERLVDYPDTLCFQHKKILQGK